MTSTLPERLHRLADQVQVEDDPAAGRELWLRGRRYQRRRRTGTAVIAGVAALLVLGIGAVTWERRAPAPAIAPAGAAVGLPSVVYEPSPWLPGTGGHPLGRIATIQPAQRGGWFGSEPGFVAISATTGEYRFLDLPGLARGTGVALAPDGLHVAYWTTGPTTGSPNTGFGQSGTVAGVAVYDSTTGEVVRHVIETEHGLWENLLVWVDADTLAIDFGQYRGGEGDSDMDQSSGKYAPALRWDLGTDPAAFPELDALWADFPTPSVAGRVALGSDDGIAIVTDAEVREIGGQGFVDPQTVAINPAGTTVVGVSQRGGRSPNRLAAAPVPADGRWVFADVTENRQNFRALGWTDDEHVVVQRRVENSAACVCMAMVEVDVRTGRATPFIELPANQYDVGLWAADLMDEPVVDRPEPPTPISPRLTLSLLVLTLGGAAFGIVRWRRRVAP